jgi:hypothetical protein
MQTLYKIKPISERKDSNSKWQAERMVSRSNKILRPIDIGDNVTIPRKRAASQTLLSVFESTSASNKPWKVDDMKLFLEKVEFSSPCLVPRLYCLMFEQKCVTRHKIFRRSPCPLSTLGSGMVTLSPISIGRKILFLCNSRCHNSNSCQDKSWTF